MTEEERKLWKRYARTSRPAARDALRNRLCELHLPLAGSLAAKAYGKYAHVVEYGDLHSAACTGLLDAIPRFELSRGVQPASFLAHRIRGAILDYLRSLDNVSRITRGRMNRVQAYADQNGRDLTPEEIYERFGWRIRCPRIFSLNDTVLRGDKGKDCFIVDTLGTRDPPSLSAAASDTSYLLRGLTARSRLIVLLYYVEGLSMRETAQAVGLSESRISQLMPRLLDHMRRNTTHLDECKEMERNQPRESERSIRTAV